MCADQFHSCKSVISGLHDLGIPEEKVHFEFFGPAVELELVNA